MPAFRNFTLDTNLIMPNMAIFSSKRVLIQIFIASAALVILTNSAALPKTHPRRARLVTERVDWRPYYIAHACEWSFLRLECPRNRVLIITRAFYGRQNLNYCSRVNNQRPTDERLCPGASSMSVHRMVAQTCSGKKECEILVYQGVFGDPCPDINKYLEVYYSCVLP